MSVQKPPLSPVPPRASAAADVATQHARYTPDARTIAPPYRETEDIPAANRRRWILPVAGGAVLALVAFWIGVTVVQPFVIDKIDHWNTGAARIWQCDLDVGHGGISHFVTEYYQGRVLVIEIQRSNPTNVHTYAIPYPFTTQPATPPIITLQAQDLNNDHRPDLLVHIEGVESEIPLYNNGQTFQAG